MTDVLHGDQDQAQAYYEQALAIVADWHPKAGQIRVELVGKPGGEATQ